MKSYKEVLAEYINNSKMTLEQISKECGKYDVKVNPTYISKLRLGTRPPASYKVTATLAKVLGENPEVLLASGVIDNKERDIKDLEEALSFIYPDYEYSRIWERSRHIIVDPESIIRNEHVFMSDMTDEEVNKLIDGNPYPELDYFEKGEVIRVPIIGKIAAGIPITADENIEGYINIHNKWGYKENELFGLIVQGDSMEGSRIFNKDKVIIKIQPDVENGEIAAVSVDGTNATLKRVKKIDGKIILFPDNPKYEPIIISDERARIMGKVIQVMFEPNSI